MSQSVNGQTGQATQAGVDLTNCDREPIHIPASIQPYGLYLAVEPETREIKIVSENVKDQLGLEPEQMIGHRLSEWVDQEVVDRFYMGYANLSGRWIGQDSVVFDLGEGEFSQMYHPIMHNMMGLLVLELEPEEASEDLESQHSMHRLLQFAMMQLNATQSIDQLYQVCCDMAFKICGYDRIMLYAFDSDWNGQVVAEHLSGKQVDSYMHQYFPASDIPVQARELYKRNLQRIIVDSSYEPSLLVPAIHPQTGQPMDMSLAVTRSISPMHVQYLVNMGVSGSMSISVIRDGELWGMIACHHDAPRYIAFERRSALEMLAHSFVQRLDQIEKINLERWQKQWEQAQDLLSETSYSIDTAALAKKYEEIGLMEFFDAISSALYVDGELVISDESIPKPLMMDLIEWLNKQESKVVYTDRLFSLFPEVGPYLAQAAGVLAICLSPYRGDWLLWLRPEWSRKVAWAGNPNKPVHHESGTQMLTPRESFARYLEVKGGESKPWNPSEIALAEAMRFNLLDRLLLRTEVMRERRELEAMESEQQFNLLANAAPMLISMWDEQGEATFFSQAWETQIGYETSLLRGQRWREKIDPEKREQITQWINEAYELKAPITAEFRYLDSQDQWRWLLMDATARYRSNGEFAGYLVTSLDITQRREAELQLRDYNDKLQKSNKELEEFAYVASHDMREPLRKIAQFGKRLRDKTQDELSPQAQAYLDHMTDASSRMNELVVSLLDYSKISMGPAEWEEVDLNRSISDAVQTLGLKTGEEKVGLNIAELPVIQGEFTQLYQLFLNLLSNAWKYRHRDRELEIEVLYRKKARGRHQIIVKDNGIGFEPRYNQQVFGVFQRLHGRSEYPGAGVGLALCRKVVERHGGEIYAVGKKDEGCSIYITLRDRPPQEEMISNVNE